MLGSRQKKRPNREGRAGESGELILHLRTWRRRPRRSPHRRRRRRSARRRCRRTCCLPCGPRIPRRPTCGRSGSAAGRRGTPSCRFRSGPKDPTRPQYKADSRPERPAPGSPRNGSGALLVFPPPWRCSSAGQSTRLISARSGVQIPAPPPNFLGTSRDCQRRRAFCQRAPSQGTRRASGSDERVGRGAPAYFLSRDPAGAASRACAASEVAVAAGPSSRQQRTSSDESPDRDEEARAQVAARRRSRRFPWDSRIGDPRSSRRG